MLGQLAFRAVSPLVPLVYLIGGLWSLGADYSWLAEKIGDFWAFLALFLLPVVLVVVPLAAGFMDGKWGLLQLSVGAMVAAFVFNAATAALASKVDL